MKSLKLLISGSILLLTAIVVWCGCGDVADNGGSGSKTVSSLAVSPTSASIEVSALQTFTAVATYSDGTSGSIVASWEISRPVGTLTLTGLTLLFQATAEGSGTLTATHSGKSATAVITVTPSTEPSNLTTIEVTASERLRVGQSKTFQAVGRGSTGEVITISPTWLISGEGIGRLTAVGTVATLETTAEGAAIISCLSGEVIGHSYATVEGYSIELSAEVDTYVDSSSPEASFGGEQSYYAGYLSGPPSTIWETYLKFDLSVISAEATIEAATLNLYVSAVSQTTLIMMLGKIYGSWETTTTWDSRPTKEGSSSSLPVSFSQGLGQTDITSIVSYEIRSGNNGFAIFTPLVSTNYLIMSSHNDANPDQRPKLTIYYSRP